MAGFSITQCRSLDSTVDLVLGTVTSNSTTLGRSDKTTNIQGNVLFNGEAPQNRPLVGTGNSVTWTSDTIEVRNVNSTANNVNLGIATNHVANTQLFLGNTGSTINVGQLRVLGTTMSTLNNVVSDTVDLFKNLTTGALNIGTALTTGALSIGTALTTGLLTIGATGPVSVAPRQPTNTYVDIGSTGSQARSGLRLFQPLTMNYGTNWTAPSTNQIGQRIDGAGGSGNSQTYPLTVRNMSLGPGTYYITGNVIYNYGTVWNITSISFTNNAQNYACCVFGSNGGGNWGVNLSLCWTVPGNTTTGVYLVVQSSNYSTIGAVVFNATRIG
jgi:hypothetical protein